MIVGNSWEALRSALLSGSKKDQYLEKVSTCKNKYLETVRAMPEKNHGVIAIEDGNNSSQKEQSVSSEPQLLEQNELFRINSPCRGVCTTNNRGYCVGCMRSRDERFNWQDLSQVERARVLALCSRRRSRVLKKMSDSSEYQLDLMLETDDPPITKDLFDPLDP